MVADASIYGLLREQKPLPGPVDQFGQLLNLKSLMTQNRLHELQAQDTEQTLGEKEAFRQGLAGLAPGETYESAVPRLMKVAPLQTLDFQNKLLEQKKLTGGIEHTAAQTGEITAGHIAGAFAALAKGNGSDQAVQDAETMMTPLVGAQKAQAVSQKLLSMPPEQRLAYAVAQAGQHKTGQEALKLFFPPATMRDTGAEVQPVSTSTLPGGLPAGTPIPGTTPLAKSMTPGTQATLTETTRHHRALEGDPQMIEDTAQAIAAGRLAPLSGFALARPSAQNIMARVVQINPDFDPTQFQTRQKAEKDFATGKQGNSVRSFNVALSHLDTLDQLADALHNGNMQAVNKVGNVIAQQTGSSAPTNFVAAKKIVADEIVKAIVGSGGGVTDREEAAKTVNSANSPAQLKGVINTYKELMRGQIGGLRQQYESTTGKTDFDTKYLSESGRQTAHGGKDKASIMSEADRILSGKP